MTGLTITIRALGRPAPQGSKRAFAGKRKDGSVYAGTVESSHYRVQSWRQAVIDAAAELGEPPQLAGPLELSMVFVMPRPRAHYRTGRRAAELRDTGPAFPARMPDLSKLCRATEDALTDAGVWADDGQVVCYGPLAKIYENGHVTGLPGVLITITEATHA
jgi:Holliday junction resolvase RusA-like endonuclease